jgi:hypothetical protein
MTDKDPMEVEREREIGTPFPEVGLVPQAGYVSSLEDPDAAEEDDLLENNVDDEREVTEGDDR